MWAKVFETESPSQADLHHLVSDDAAVPGNLGPVPNANAVTEIEWQILQTDTMNPSANELSSSKQMGNGNESVTRRYEFYKYVGPYDINSSDGPNTGTNEALCASVGPDGIHGVGINAGIDCIEHGTGITDAVIEKFDFKIELVNVTVFETRDCCARYSVLGKEKTPPVHIVENWE